MSNNQSEETERHVDEVSSSSDEDSPAPRKKAATKKRTLKSVDNIASCGIYSSLSTESGLGELRFSNLPPGFSFEDDEEDEEDDLPLFNKRKRKIDQEKTAKSNNNKIHNLDESTPEKEPYTQHTLRSPSPPPPPPAPSEQMYGRGLPNRHKTSTKTSKLLQKIDSSVLKYRISSFNDSLNDSFNSPMRTQGGSSNVIDLDSPSFVRNTRLEMTVKIRTRGGIQKFVMQMSDMFSNTIDRLAQVEGVDRCRIKLLRGDDDVTEFETPAAINLRISDILECVIIDPSSVSAEADDSELNITPSVDDGVQIKIQGRDRSSKMTDTLGKDQPMRELMGKYSQTTGISLDKLKFYFDGDVVGPNDTPDSLDMDEEGGVLDVVISA